MKSLKTHQYLLIFLLLILALTCVISPWMALGADWVAERWPELLSGRVPFSRVVSALFAGIFTGVLEEIFFRGILFLGLLQQGWTLRAYFLANLFYSLVHFVKPGENYFLNGVDPFAGFRHLLTTFEPLLDPVPLVPGILGLLLI